MKKTAPFATVAGSSTITKVTSIVTTFKERSARVTQSTSNYIQYHLEDDLPLLDEVDVLLGVGERLVRRLLRRVPRMLLCNLILLKVKGISDIGTQGVKVIQGEPFAWLKPSVDLDSECFTIQPGQ